MSLRSWMFLIGFTLVAVTAGAIVVQKMTTTDPVLRLDDTAKSWPDIRLSNGKKSYVEIPRQGGTGYLWEATTENPKTAVIERVPSRIESDSSDTPRVGRPEVDLFMITAVAVGETRAVFSLQRVQGDPVRSISVQVKVVP